MIGIEWAGPRAASFACAREQMWSKLKLWMAKAAEANSALPGAAAFRVILFSVIALQIIEPTAAFVAGISHNRPMRNLKLLSDSSSRCSLGAKSFFPERTGREIKAEANSGVKRNSENPTNAAISLFSSCFKSNVFHKLLLLLRDVYGQFLVLFMDTFINRYHFLLKVRHFRIWGASEQAIPAHIESGWYYQSQEVDRPDW
jgi:hypothetical protein